MKRLIFILLVLICSVSYGQVYQSMPQAGYGPVQRMLFDSVVTLPMGITRLRNISGGRDTAQIRYNKADSSIYVYTGSQWVKSSGSGGSTIDTTSLSNRINLKLNIVDTINQFVSSVSQPNDSSLTFVKGSTASTYIIRSSIAASATRMVTSVYNKSGATISKGAVVYIDGAHSSILPSIALSKANTEETSAYTYGIVDADIPNNSQGVVVQIGVVTGLNLPTSSYTDGQTLYLSPTVAGGYTTTKPLAPNHYVAIGTVIRAHPNQGTIQVAIRNGFQLDEMSDVQIPLVPNDSTVLQFSRVDSLWHAVSPTNVIGGYGWKTSGNSDVNAGRFIGSTNNASLRLRTNNTERIVIDSIGSVGIGTTLAAASSIVDITSTGKGLLIPRMSTSARDAISSPASQLLVSNTDKKTLDQYNGTSWNSIAGDFSDQLQMINLMGGDIIAAPFHPISMTTGSTALSNTFLNMVAVVVQKETIATGVQWFQGSQGVYTANNTNGVALYSVNPTTYVVTKIAESTNDGNIWKGSTGSVQTKDFATPVTIQPGLYYIGALYSSSAQTTAPVVWGTAIGQLINNSRGLNVVPYSTKNGQSTFPATYSAGTNANYSYTFLLY
jgi:hypothetical protein